MDIRLVHLDPVVVSVGVTRPLLLYDEEGVVMRRLAEAEETFLVLLFLVNDAAENIHLGQVITVLD